MKQFFIAGIFVLAIQQSVAHPVMTEEEELEIALENHRVYPLEYRRYLIEVMEVLANDQEYMAQMKVASKADIESGDIAEILNSLHYDVRSELDEVKRQEVQRLNELYAHTLQHKDPYDPEYLKVVHHLDHDNHHSFEVKDLKKLISKGRSDLDKLDEERREKFKEYEMQKTFEQEEKLKGLTEEERKKKEEELHAVHDKSKHEPILDPGSKEQLEEVWEQQDHLDREDFNLDTFFRLHDLDGNDAWDYNEVKALLVKQLDKYYDKNTSDSTERYEELERMREHVFQRADLNKDGMLDKQEFLADMRNQKFNKSKTWETIDKNPYYTEEEYKKFVKQKAMRQGRMPPPDPQMGHPNQQYPHQDQPMPQHQQQLPLHQFQQQMPPQQIQQQITPPQFQQQMPLQQFQQQMLPQQFQQQLPPQQFQQQMPPQQFQQQLSPQQFEQQITQPQFQKQIPPQQYQQQMPLQQFQQQM